MVDLPESIYGCSIVLGLGDTGQYSISKKQEMWELWMKYKSHCLNNEEENITDIFKVTYPLEEYTSDTMKEYWGCIDDVESLSEDITLNDKQDIYSSIQVVVEAYYSPPFKWCEYMWKKGFIVSLYFINLDDRTRGDDNCCGEMIYGIDNVWKTYSIPKIDGGDFKKLYKRGRYRNLNEMIRYSNTVFRKCKMCINLCNLLDLWGNGPQEIAIKNFITIDSFHKMQQLEEKISTNKINEWEYIEECKKIKEYYETMIY